MIIKENLSINSANKYRNLIHFFLIFFFFLLGMKIFIFFIVQMLMHILRFNYLILSTSVIRFWEFRSMTFTFDYLNCINLTKDTTKTRNKRWQDTDGDELVYETMELFVRFNGCFGIHNGNNYDIRGFGDFHQNVLLRWWWRWLHNNKKTARSLEKHKIVKKKKFKVILKIKRYLN